MNDRSNDSQFADQLVDELVPADLDWRRLVTSYPVVSVSVATLAGFLLGRSHGSTLLTAASAYMGREMSRNILSVLDGDLSGSAASDR